MILQNLKYLDGNFQFRTGCMEIDDGIIKRIFAGEVNTEENTVIDCAGYTALPGFVDIHIHGCAGGDACDCKREAIESMASYLITKGVTSFCPTTMTVPENELRQAVINIRDCAENPPEGARIVGINMEGPFISPQKKGAQNAGDIRLPDFELFKEIFELSGGLIKLVDIAPEMENGYDFIEKASQLCVVSVAHSTAGYDEMKRAFDCGASHATHLFNAMTGLSHREPGAVGAVFDDDRVIAELISDGVHIHPAALRLAFSVLGDRAVVISDAMRASGMPDGEEFDLGGQNVVVKDGKALLKDGTIAGSVTNLFDEVKNLVRFGIPIERAVKAATILPASSIGLQNEIGSLEEGKRADIILLDEELNIAAVYHQNS